MMNQSFALTRTLEEASHDEARRRIVSSLQEEGFGILTEIDVAATLKEKLDAAFRRYVILGACNPKLAHEALSTDPGVGLLLPCNVVVTEDDEGRAVISIADPRAMMKIADAPERFDRLMVEARSRLERALERA